MCASIRYRQPIQFAHSHRAIPHKGRRGGPQVDVGWRRRRRKRRNLILIGPQYSVQGGVSNISPHTRIADISSPSPLIYIPTTPPTGPFYIFFFLQSFFFLANPWLGGLPSSLSYYCACFLGVPEELLLWKKEKEGVPYLILSPPLLLVSPYDLRGYFLLPLPQWMLSTASFPAPHLKIKFDNFTAEKEGGNGMMEQPEPKRHKDEDCRVYSTIPILGSPQALVEEEGRGRSSRSSTERSCWQNQQQQSTILCHPVVVELPSKVIGRKRRKSRHTE